jgi:hypothetical protein
MLYFVSNRKSSGITNIFNQDNEHLYKVYKAPLRPDGLGKVSLFQPDKSYKLTSGSIAFSPDGQSHIATLNKNRTKNSKFLVQSTKSGQANPLGLFQISQYESQNSNYIPLPFSEYDEFSYAQPTFSPDGQMIVFVSDMGGGYGETDLYYSQLTTFGWSDPTNLGNIVNSSDKELFPFFHYSGKLYFSSNRNGGMGGFDIYYSTFENNTWSAPILLQEPINSPFDDFSCYIFPDETSGFFSSSREGKDNIYRFDYVFQFCEYSEEVQEENYCFTFFEERAIMADTIPVKYQWEFSDGTKALGVEVDHCFPGPGEYEISLSVIDSLSDEYLYSVAEYSLELERPQQVYIDIPEKVNINEPVILKAELTGFYDAENIRYFWSIVDGETIMGETITYNFTKKGTYTIRCEAYWEDGQSFCSMRTIKIE